MRIRLTWPSGRAIGVLEDTPTARAVFHALPAKSAAHRWGKEVYFDLPIKAATEKDAREVVEPGTICYWVEGLSLAIPFGQTPASRETECRLVTAVERLDE